MTLLYITFIDFGNKTSGSSVRPQKMYEAFEETGVNIKLLEGQQNQRKQRRKNVREILDWLETNRPDICYIEPPSGPFFNHVDHVLLRKLKEKKIPTGLFYRDMYWKFGLGNQDIGTTAKLKKYIVKLMHRYDWRILMKTLSIIYFPTIGMSALLPCRIPAKPLPPGCFYVTDKTPTVSPDNIPTGVYIGGLAELYGGMKMLRAAAILHEKGVQFHLKLICREAEWARFVSDNSYADIPPWLEVLHISGDEALSTQYAQSDFALCPHEVNAYNNITISVKLMEYISYLKPVVVTGTLPMKAVVTANNIGIVTDDSVQSFSDGMQRMIEDKVLREEFAKNCIAAREDNLWVRRAESVVKDLTSLASQEMKT